MQPSVIPKANSLAVTVYYDLIDLRLLVAVIETGSITAGANRACLSLSSASTRIGGLEKQMGIALLVRGRRGATATPAGQMAYGHAKAILRQMALLSGELSEFTHGLQGHIRLLANTVATGHFLPGLLSEFLRRYPGVNIELDEMPSQAIVRGVAEGVADLGIAADHADFSGLETRPFRSDRLMLVVPRDHTLAGYEAVSFSHALDYEFIGLPADNALQRHLAGHAVRMGKTQRLRARVSGLDNVYRMVAHGAGIAVLPIAMADNQPAGDRVRFIPLTESWAGRSLMLTLRRFDDLTLPAKRLADYLVASFDDPVPAFAR